MKEILLTFVLFATASCVQNEITFSQEPEVFLVVLGIAQDAGYPQANCTKTCCTQVWKGVLKREKVVSLGLVDKLNNKVYMFDATPDFKDQLRSLLSYLPEGNMSSVGGIFLTHAHIGHYTGLMQLGHEVMGANKIPVFAMPKMKSFLEENGPWSQLVSLENIKINALRADSTIQLSTNIKVIPFLVPHRDEYSETVGYKVSVNNKSSLFIPDIDKWNKWDRDIVHEVEQVDYAFLDATFYNDKELPDRNMHQIPHPFVSETMALFKNSTTGVKNKIILIHFNHTNALLHNGDEYKAVLNSGYSIARESSVYRLD